MCGDLQSKILVLNSTNALSRLGFEHDLNDAYNSGYDIEDSYIVSEDRIVFLLLSHSKGLGDGK